MVDFQDVLYRAVVLVGVTGREGVGLEVLEFGIVYIRLEGVYQTGRRGNKQKSLVRRRSRCRRKVCLLRCVGQSKPDEFG